MNRQTFIGGSEAHHLVPGTEYGCLRQLVLTKRTGVGVESNWAMEQGHIFEGYIGKRFSEVTGWKTRKVQRSFSDPPFAAHLDFEATDGKRGWGVVDAKCVNWNSYRRICWGGAEESHVLQMQVYMGMSGRKWAALAYLNKDSGDLRVVEVPRDEQLIQMLRDRAQIAWGLVENGPLPQVLDPSSKPCRRCQFRHDCHQIEPLPAWEGDVARNDAPELAQLLEERAELKAIESDAVEAVELVNGKIKAAIGAAQVVDAPGYRIYHTASERRTIDTARLRKAMPEVAKEFEKVSQVKSLRVYERTI